MATRKKHSIQTAAWTALLIALAATAIRLLDSQIVKAVQDADISGYTVMGIDVSAHNGRIDFPQAKRHGVDFAIIKATEGRTFRDSLFERNYRNARDAGLKVGAYHFFRFDVDGAEQARNFAGAVAGKTLSMPLVIDVENHTNPYTPLPGKVVRRLRNMIDELAVYNYPVMIYTNKKGLNDLICDQFGDCRLWICTFTRPGEHIDWDVWQYSHWGKVPGIAGDVDLDVFRGDSTQWDGWTRHHENKISISNELFTAINGDSLR